MQSSYGQANIFTFGMYIYLGLSQTMGAPKRVAFLLAFLCTSKKRVPPKKDTHTHRFLACPNLCVLIWLQLLPVELGPLGRLEGS